MILPLPWHVPEHACEYAGRFVIVRNRSLRLIGPSGTSVVRAKDSTQKMAQIMQVKLVDDIDGGEAAESLAFSLDGKFYEIDLSDTHAAALRDAFAPFITNARRAGSGPKVASRQRMSMRTGRAREETAAIREWAHAHGLEVSTRGRISSTVLSCFAVFVDQVPAAAQAARTARVSWGVACSGHGLRNLAAMMTRRSLMVMSS